MTDWVSRFYKVFPLDTDELEQILDHARGLPSDDDASAFLSDLLEDTTEANALIADFVQSRHDSSGKDFTDGNGTAKKPANLDDPMAGEGPVDNAPPPAYAMATPRQSAPAQTRSAGTSSNLFSGNPHHTNDLIRASNARAQDEQDMQQQLQMIQYKLNIWNAEVEPEHDTEYYCNCMVHQYQRRKMARLSVQKMWSKAVMYPGERFYSNLYVSGVSPLMNNNPYVVECGTPFSMAYGYSNFAPLGVMSKPRPEPHLRWTQRTIALNNRLNEYSQNRVDKLEPAESIWESPSGTTDISGITSGVSSLGVDEKSNGDTKDKSGFKSDVKSDISQVQSVSGESSKSAATGEMAKKSKFGRFKQALGIRSSEEKAAEFSASLRSSILNEEAGRWPDKTQRQLVANYQEKVGMASHIAALRAHKPLQYLHLLRAGYFEPIPVAWANQASNPLKFTVEAREGWRGITPAWRGYEDLAEERLYWVLNHREGSVGMRMKPDIIWEMDMAQKRMSAAVEPPPMYFSPDDTCMQQHTSSGHSYSKQVMPSPFRAYDQPEKPTDDSMILLDVSGSMNFDPVRPVYEHYLVTRYLKSTQPKNKDVAKSIIRRFTDALGHHDHQTAGYDLVTFSDYATHVGTINHRNFDSMWAGGVRVGGGTRVMTGWQKVKDLHFQKHHESAIHHPIYGWQAGPETPILRLLLFLDGEAQDMDEFELDLLGLSWAHVTIFLIGVDNCPHHHRHANELQRISDVNHHVSFVDAQGNCPERFVTHELLKRHLGYDISMREFVEMETPPEYTA